MQHRDTKLVPEISNFKYEDRLIALDLKTLNVRRKRGDLIQLYKFLHGIDKIEINKNFFLVNSNLRGHRFKYYKEVATELSREHFFFDRIANLWNSLPNEVVTVSVDNFKAALDCWLMSNQA